ncbi:MAG TPA: Uma2 family endonuclease [Leptolyngbya sp.]|jgi:Uma2 family endonuclease|nr:Uma2 family endonuclease [Leptolyngbya sp.]
MQVQLKRYTPEEYLELEEAADYKNEYRDGEIIPMIGGTTNHNELSLNFAAALKNSLKRQNYKIYIGDVRLWIPRYQQYTYPNVMVILGQPSYHGKGTTTVTNPQVIAEVLSKSTQNYDQGDKFTAYRSIPSLREYLLIDQVQFRVMQYTKTDAGSWILTETEGETATLTLQTIAFQLPIGDLYEGVDFAQSEPPPEPPDERERSS